MAVGGAIGGRFSGLGVAEEKVYVIGVTSPDACVLFAYKAGV